MKTFKRIHDIFSSNVNHALDKMENPAKLIRYTITEMEETLEKAKASATETKCTIKGRERALEECKTAATRWEIRAQMAVKNGKEELAKEAISERQKASAKVKEIEEELVTLREISASQEVQIVKLSEKLQEVKAKERTLIARAEHAKEKLEMEKQINAFDCSAAIKRFSEMEEKVERLEAEASVATQTSKVEASFASLEKDASVETEFNELKAKYAN